MLRIAPTDRNRIDLAISAWTSSTGLHVERLPGTAPDLVDLFQVLLEARKETIRSHVRMSGELKPDLVIRPVHRSWEFY